MNGESVLGLVVLLMVAVGALVAVAAVAERGAGQRHVAWCLATTIAVVLVVVYGAQRIAVT